MRHPRSGWALWWGWRSEELADFLLHLEGVLVLAEGLFELGVDPGALWGLVEDVAEGVDALHEAGADLLGGVLLLAQPDGSEGEQAVEGEAGEGRGSGGGDEAGGGLDEGFEAGLGADDA